jgi:hypothetical protein
MRWGAVLVCGVFAACSPAPPPYKAIADTKLLMSAVIDPAADHIWESAGADITFDGVVEIAPRSEEEWTLLRNSAVTLAESGNLLMMPPRGHDEEWMRLSQALIEAAASAISAAEKHDVQQIFDVGGEIYAVCSSCHSKYSPQIANRVRN